MLRNPNVIVRQCPNNSNNPADVQKSKFGRCLLKKESFHLKRCIETHSVRNSVPSQLKEGQLTRVVRSNQLSSASCPLAISYQNDWHRLESYRVYYPIDALATFVRVKIGMCWTNKTACLRVTFPPFRGRQPLGSVIDVTAIKLIEAAGRRVSLSACICRPPATNGKVSRRGTRSAAWHDLLFRGTFVCARARAPVYVCIYFVHPPVIHVNRARHCLIQFYSSPALLSVL